MGADRDHRGLHALRGGGGQYLAHRWSRERDTTRERNDAIDRVLDAGYDVADALSQTEGALNGIPVLVQLGDVDTHKALGELQLVARGVITASYRLQAAIAAYGRRFGSDANTERFNELNATVARVRDFLPDDEGKSDPVQTAAGYQAIREDLLDALLRASGAEYAPRERRTDEA